MYSQRNTANGQLPVVILNATTTVTQSEFFWSIYSNYSHMTFDLLKCQLSDWPPGSLSNSEPSEPSFHNLQ